jgi:radical SAM superfamily enzyme YgiQ (UPF0313 family)
MRVLLVSANREALPSPVVPIGVLSVAGSVRAAHETRLVDVCFSDDPMTAVRHAVADFQPQVIGVGLRNLHSNAYDGSEKLIAYYAELVAALRSVTAAPVVLGGGAFSLQPNLLLERTGADHGVVGEGERVFVDLVDMLARGETPPRLMSAQSVAPRSAGPIRLQKPGALHSDLDLLPPPARDLVDPRYYAIDGTDSIQTKRGCAFQCTYCDYPDIEGRQVRVRDPEVIADEVMERSRIPGVSHIFFVDSVFNVPPAHALAVCKALIARASRVPWVCYGTPAAFSEELVAAMVEAGCQGVEIGSDAGTEKMLRRLKKPFNLEDILRTRELFVRHNLLDSHTFVLGSEGETVEEARETLAFADRLNPDIAVFIVFMEDREAMTIHRARHREALLELLAKEAPNHTQWLVPELGIRFGQSYTNAFGMKKFDGPNWLKLARMVRRRTVGGRRIQPATPKTA